MKENEEPPMDDTPAGQVLAYAKKHFPTHKWVIINENNMAANVDPRSIMSMLLASETVLLENPAGRLMKTKKV